MSGLFHMPERCVKVGLALEQCPWRVRISKRCGTVTALPPHEDPLEHGTFGWPERSGTYVTRYR